MCSGVYKMFMRKLLQVCAVVYWEFMQGFVYRVYAVVCTRTLAGGEGRGWHVQELLQGVYARSLRSGLCKESWLVEKGVAGMCRSLCKEFIQGLCAKTLCKEFGWWTRPGLACAGVSARSLFKEFVQWLCKEVVEGVWPSEESVAGMCRILGKEFMQGLCARALCKEFSQGLCARTLCKDFMQEVWLMEKGVAGMRRSLCKGAGRASCWCRPELSYNSVGCYRLVVVCNGNLLLCISSARIGPPSC
jgi:hypothetical protein